MKLQDFADLRLKCERKGNMTHDVMASGQTILENIDEIMEEAQSHDILDSPVYSTPSGKLFMLEVQVVPVKIKQEILDAMRDSDD